jgi:excisionase family DNA binding protein
VTTARDLEELPLVLTVKEAAPVFRIGERQLRAAIARGEIYAARIGSSIRIPRSSIEAWLAGGTKNDREAWQPAVVEGGRRHGHRS